MKFNISIASAVFLLSSAVSAMPAGNKGDQVPKLELNAHTIYYELIPLIKKYYTIPQGGQDDTPKWSNVKIDLLYALGGGKAYHREESCRRSIEESEKKGMTLMVCNKYPIFEEHETPARSMDDIRYIEAAFQVQGGEYGTITIRSNDMMTDWEKPERDPKPMKKNFVPPKMLKFDFKDAVQQAQKELKKQSNGGFSSVVLLPPGADKVDKGDEAMPYYIFQNWKPSPKKSSKKTPSDVFSHPTLTVVGATDGCVNYDCEKYWIASPQMRTFFNLETQLGWQKSPSGGPEGPTLVGNDKFWDQARLVH